MTRDGERELDERILYTRYVKNSEVSVRVDGIYYRKKSLKSALQVVH